MSVIKNIIESKYFKKLYLHLFLCFSYASTLLFILLDLFPHLIRNIVFKLLLSKMGKSVMIDYKVYMRNMGNIQIGNNVYINRGCQFYTSAHMGKKIVLGDGVTISPNVTFYGAAQDYTSKGMPDTADDIVVEEHAWICANTTVLQGVTIGRYSVIGAGSVVTKNIPPFTVAVGNPAKVIKQRNKDECHL